MKPEEFKELYNKGKTWGDLEKTIDELTFEQIKNLALHLEETKKWTGLDMRQQFLLGSLTGRIYVKEEMF